MTLAAGLVGRLAERDRQLLERIMLGDGARSLTRRAWVLATHAGGVVASLAASTLPLAAGGVVADGARRALAILVGSHLLVQLVKRSVGRPRPGLGRRPSVAAPDRFSFPSGHAAASLSVALGYAGAYPAIAAPLVIGAVVVAASRVVLGVHYPADVVAGQLLAVLTAIGCGVVL